MKALDTNSDGAISIEGNVANAQTSAANVANARLLAHTHTRARAGQACSDSACLTQTTDVR